MFRQMTIGFLILSFALWILTNSFSSLCWKVDEPDFGLSFAKNLGQNVTAPSNQALKVVEIRQWMKDNYPKEITKFICNHHISNESLDEPETDLSLAVIGAVNLNHTAISNSSEAQLREVVQETFLDELSLNSYDIVLSNLISSFHFKSYVSSFKIAGELVLSLANQHIMAHGRSTVAETVQMCDSANIHWIGLNAKSHEIINFKGLKIGFLAFCGLFSTCMDSNLPLEPVRYTTKGATIAVQELQQHGVEKIIVLIYWGREYSYFPDETALYAARHLAQLGVAVVLGFHPHLMQDHAYFGNTLVIFSPGYSMFPLNTPQTCWEKLPSGKMQYKDSIHCKMVNPSIRHSLADKEHHTRMYKISITNKSSVKASYSTLSLEVYNTTNLIRPLMKHRKKSHWFDVCSRFDNHCLSCTPF